MLSHRPTSRCSWGAPHTIPSSWHGAKTCRKGSMRACGTSSAGFTSTSIGRLTSFWTTTRNSPRQTFTPCCLGRRTSPPSPDISTFPPYVSFYKLASVTRHILPCAYRTILDMFEVMQRCGRNTVRYAHEYCVRRSDAQVERMLARWPVNLTYIINQNGATSGFEMCIAPSALGAAGRNQNTSRIQIL